MQLEYEKFGKNEIQWKFDGWYFEGKPLMGQRKKLDAIVEVCRRDLEIIGA